MITLLWFEAKGATGGGWLACAVGAGGYFLTSAQMTPSEVPLT